ncbi:MAG: hypothetical protein NZ550_00925 [Fimbriimonadales bacterium]|nr:hypothetical protein [Fimbriimonadales bacterium]MDW8051377.1 hypothetical protein [Armatimonadota bacterium]
MNWAVVPRITGGLGCMLVLTVGILTGTDPLLCTVRGLIAGMVGWVAGALWAFVMSHLMPTPTFSESASSTATHSNAAEPETASSEDEDAAAA